MKIGAWLVLALATLAGTGCGGGGGGSSNGGSPPSPSPTVPVDVDAPSFRFNPRILEGSFSTLMTEALDNGARLLSYAQFVTDMAQRFATSSDLTTVTANCAYTGTITLQFNDRDGNHQASTGDSITALLDNCGVPTLARAASGTLRIDIQIANPSTDIGFQARLSIVDTLKITPLGGGPNIGSIQTGSLRGSLGVQWSDSTQGSQLRALSTPEDDLSFTTSYDGIESIDKLRKIDVSRTVSYEQASIGGSIAFLFDVGARGGMLRIKTPLPFQGDLNVLPKQFRVDAEIADGRKLRAERGRSGGTSTLVDTLLIESNGTITMTNPIGWSQFASVTQDVRNASAVYQASDQGGGFITIAPWNDSAFGSEVDRICQQSTSAGVSNFRADALFQRPVAAQPGLTEANSVLKLQFGRALATDTPALQFRFTDSAEVIDAGSPPWSVAASAVRRGALYEVRPAEPLRRGRTYYLQTSYDGINWTGDRIIRDQQGQIVNQSQQTFANIYTDSSLVASTLGSDLATVTTTAPAHLSSIVSLRDGQTVSAYLWEQISGPTLRLLTPQAALTDAVLVASGPQPIRDALVQLTVTDSLGRHDRVRVALKVGNTLSQGAALYTETRAGLSAPKKELLVGTGSIFYGPDPGIISPRVPAPNEGGTGVNFSVVPANAQALALGDYTDAIFSTTPGARNGLISRVFCNGPDALVTGSFKVLDLAFAADGTISRLAIDFEQRCVEGLAEYQKGSYRYNSDLPLNP